MMDPSSSSQLEEWDQLYSAFGADDPEEESASSFSFVDNNEPQASSSISRSASPSLAASSSLFLSASASSVFDESDQEAEELDSATSSFSSTLESQVASLVEALAYAQTRARQAEKLVEDYDARLHAAVLRALRWADRCRAELRRARSEMQSLQGRLRQLRSTATTTTARSAEERATVVLVESNSPLSCSASSASPSSSSSSPSSSSPSSSFLSSSPSSSFSFCVTTLAARMEQVSRQVQALEREYESRRTLLRQLELFIGPILFWRQNNNNESNSNNVLIGGTMAPTAIDASSLQERLKQLIVEMEAQNGEGLFEAIAKRLLLSYTSDSEEENEEDEESEEGTTRQRRRRRRTRTRSLRRGTTETSKGKEKGVNDEEEEHEEEQEEYEDEPEEEELQQLHRLIQTLKEQLLRLESRSHEAEGRHSELEAQLEETMTLLRQERERRFAAERRVRELEVELQQQQRQQQQQLVGVNGSNSVKAKKRATLAQYYADVCAAYGLHDIDERIVGMHRAMNNVMSWLMALCESVVSKASAKFFPLSDSPP
ncbi:Bone sialoprotein 2 [Balamuthia mandrillaris]